MEFIKNVVKKILRLDEKTGVSTLDDLIYIGSKLHGYWIPDDFLNEQSVCYCAGAGTDISFDTELKTRFGASVFIFDPAPAAHNHFLLLKELGSRNEPLPVLGQDSAYRYRYKISFDQLNEIHFIERGVWSHRTVLSFYDTGLSDYVQHSPKAAGKANELPVDSIANYMKEFGHDTIDLLKIKIEGAEHIVIDSILEDNVDVKIIVVDFEHNASANGTAHLLRVNKSCNRLKKSGYILVHSTKNLKRTFIRKDIYNRLFF